MPYVCFRTQFLAQTRPQQQHSGTQQELPKLGSAFHLLLITPGSDGKSQQLGSNFSLVCRQ